MAKMISYDVDYAKHPYSIVEFKYAHKAVL